MSEILDVVANDSSPIASPAELAERMHAVTLELRANTRLIDSLCRELPAVESDYKRALLGEKAKLWFEYGKSWPQQVHSDQADLHAVDLWDAYNVQVLALKSAQAKQRSLLAQIEVMRTQSADFRNYTK